MKCPTCFVALAPFPTHFVCQGRCNATENAAATAARGYPVAVPTITEVPPPPGPQAPVSTEVACSRCHETTRQEACRYCFGNIPQGWRSAKVTAIALAGARATGKSVLMAVTRGQLELMLERFHRSPLTPIGNTNELFENRYLKPLYEEGNLLQATAVAGDAQGSRESFIFRFNERLPDGSARPRILVLRDVAGEDLEKGNDRALRYLSRADGVVAMLDPLKVNEIRNMLLDLIPGDTRLGGDGLPVIQYVLNMMGANGAGGRTGIPLALVLSKFDVLQRLREVTGSKWGRIMNRPGSPLQRDPSLRSGSFDFEDGQLLHHEVVGLLEELHAQKLEMMLDENASNYQFFVASALGSAPGSEKVDPRGIAPFRVLDPFKWLMQVAQ